MQKKKLKNRNFLISPNSFEEPPKSQAPIFQPHPKKEKALFQTVVKGTALKISIQFEKLKLV